MQTKYFEDFLIGERIETSGITLTEAQIIDFALVYDPQPIHVDTVAASKGPFGGLIGLALVVYMILALAEFMPTL